MIPLFTNFPLKAGKFISLQEHQWTSGRAKLSEAQVRHVMKVLGHIPDTLCDSRGTTYRVECVEEGRRNEWFLCKP